MKKLFISKQMMLAGLVALPLVAVGADDTNANANTNSFRTDVEGGLSFDPDGGTSTELCDGFPLIPDTGWQPCMFESQGDIDEFTLELEAEGCLRITDLFLKPDNMTATKTENGKSLTTSAFAGQSLPPLGGLDLCQAAWENSEHVKGEGGLRAGSHTIEMTLTDPNTGVIPAGYCIRFDTESPACRALKSEKLATHKIKIIMNKGNERTDVYLPDGSTAAENVAPGVSVMFGIE